jgi:hypothetical protein
VTDSADVDVRLVALECFFSHVGMILLRLGLSCSFVV